MRYYSSNQCILIILAIIQTSTSFTTNHYGYTTKINPRSRRRTISSLSSAVLESSTSNNNNRSSFHQRMRNLAKPVKKSTTSNKRKLKNMYVAHTLEDYKLLVGDEKEQIVIVRFFATWCKVCLLVLV